MRAAVLLLPSVPWLPPPLPSTRPSRLSPQPPPAAVSGATVTEGGGGGELTARERRQLRQERREGRAAAGGWREEVEERLLRKPKKRTASWMEDLNLDLLARLGPQWWVVRVSRVTGQEIADRLARSLARNFPNIEFKVYYPSVHEKRKLKNGSYSTKAKPLFPGCVFLHCILNKEIHDFIREEVDGVGGFVGSKVGNTKRQINRPKPVPVDEMEAIFKQAKEEQDNTDKLFEEQEQGVNNKQPEEYTRTMSRSKKEPGKINKSPRPGDSVRVLSGPFAEFSGCLKELDPKTGKATVGFSLFGKESYVDLNIEQIDVVNT